MEFSSGSFHGGAVEKLRRVIEAASGQRKAELVLKNAAYVNVFTEEVCVGDIAVQDGIIAGIGNYFGELETDMTGKVVCPGFLDAHIHLESALVCPWEFMRASLLHGTTAVVTDPHEIANVLGTDGIDFMLQATKGLPIDVFFMLPSCVPAFLGEENGATLDKTLLEKYDSNERVLGLAEMMNVPGLLGSDAEVLSKLAAADLHGWLVDGHAPGLSGKALSAYIAAGIFSDHECSTDVEAREKLKNGQFIMIREGTAAKNLAALFPLLKRPFAERCMFCTDDRHPSDLLNEGHIDSILRCAVCEHGVDPVLAVKSATLIPAQYFHLKRRGAVAPGYFADLAVVNSLEGFSVEAVYKNGKLVYGKDGLKAFSMPQIDEALLKKATDTFHMPVLSAEDFCKNVSERVIGMVGGELLTTDEGTAERIDTSRDILKMAVIERHRNTGHMGICYLHGYGLRSGAVATSVSHDSHNLIVIGDDEASMALAANRVRDLHGGIVVADENRVLSELPLKIAGIMSDSPLETVIEQLENAKQHAFSLGVSRNIDPFMTLSFMALPVIPKLRLTTHGVVEVGA